jgi:hypothetical protein
LLAKRRSFFDPRGCNQASLIQRLSLPNPDLDAEQVGAGLRQHALCLDVDARPPP